MSNSGKIDQLRVCLFVFYRMNQETLRCLQLLVQLVYRAVLDLLLEVYFLLPVLLLL